MMQKILKGDTSGAVSLALADGYDYSNATVEVRYQGAVRYFKNCTAGQTLTFTLTAEETAPMALGAFPVTVRIGKTDGSVLTVTNAGVKIAVTDCVEDVRAGGAIIVDARGGLYGVDDLPAHYTVKDLRAKINEIITKLGGGAAALCLLACTAFGAGVTANKATLEDLDASTAKVVTNVTFDASGLATSAEVGGTVTNVVTKEFVKGLGVSGNVESVNGQTGIVNITSVSYATSAGSANSASSANYATRAGNANVAARAGSADNATFSLFVCSDLVSTSSGGGRILRSVSPGGSGGTYTNFPGGVVTNYNNSERYAMGFITESTNRLMVAMVDDNTVIADEDSIEEVAFVSDLDGFVPTIRKVNGQPLTQDITIEGMTANAVVLTNGAAKTKGGTAITPAHVGAASASDLTDLAGTVETASAKAEQANLYSSGVYQYMIGNTNAWFAETNYVTNAEITNRTQFVWEDGMNAGTVPGSMAMWEIRDGQRQRVWDQRDWTAWYWSFKSSQLSNNLASVIGAVSDEVGTNCMKRGWAKYTAVRGLDNPDPSALVVDTPKVQLFAGHQWEKLVETGGAGYWTLTGNGIELSAADTTNTFLTVKDFEGNACLTFRKTSSYLVYCECGTDITSNYMDGQGRVVFHITTDVQPTAEFSTTLDLDDFVEQGESGCPANYEWTGSAGNWDCHFLLKPGIVADSCFARFKVMRQGENVVEHTIPIKINGGIIFDNNGQSVKIRPTVTSTAVGSAVNWVVAQ